MSDAISDAVSKLSQLHDVRLPAVVGGSLVVEQYVLTNPALNSPLGRGTGRFDDNLAHHVRVN